VRPQPAPAARGGKQDRLVITGIGAATSLASDAITSCAGARAGLVRPVPLDVETDAEGEDGEPVIGHRARGLTDGFAGAARLLRLALAAADDLRRTTPGLDDGASALFLQIRDDFHDAADRTADRTVPRAQLLAGVDGDAPGEWMGFEARVTAVLLDGVARRLGVAADKRFLVRGGAALLSTTLSQARDLLNRRVVRRCIIGAVDSPVDLPRVLLMQRLGLVRSAELPHGVAPGEAAALVVVEGRGEGLAAISAWNGASAPEHLFEARRPSGRALADAVEGALAGLGRAPQAHAAISNLSGGEYRAWELAQALVALRARGLELGNLELWYPATSFGEVGAAAGVLAAVMAVRALARRYAGGDDVLLLPIADDGERAAVVVSRS
jgi:3-oxoacyl-[acyl-carrier-protein] synthase-1